MDEKRRTSAEGSFLKFCSECTGVSSGSLWRRGQARRSLVFFFFFVSLCGVRMSPLGTLATVGLLYQPRMIDNDYGAVGGMRIEIEIYLVELHRHRPCPPNTRWNEDWQGKPKYSEKTCPSATLSTKNPTWPDLVSNPGSRGGKPATNRLSYGTASRRSLIQFWICFFFLFSHSVTKILFL
jgi:hypothetical protein